MALYLRILGVFLALAPTPMNAAGYSMPGHNRADFDVWPVAKCHLIFSNVGK